MKENLERLNRNKSTNEFFTPLSTIERLALDNSFELDVNKNYIEPCVGSGRMLCVIRDKLIKQGHTQEQVLKKLWGCDIILENCVQSIENIFHISNPKVLSNIPEKYQKPGLKHIFVVNNKIFPHIVCADSTIYDLSFFGKSLIEQFGNDLFEIS